MPVSRVSLEQEAHGLWKRMEKNLETQRINVLKYNAKECGLYHVGNSANHLAFLSRVNDQPNLHIRMVTLEAGRG